MHVHGTCSNCDGAVATPGVWGGIIPPVPRCQSCGATSAQHGQVIKMNPPQERNNFEKVLITDSTLTNHTALSAMEEVVFFNRLINRK